MKAVFQMILSLALLLSFSMAATAYTGTLNAGKNKLKFSFSGCELQKEEKATQTSKNGSFISKKQLTFTVQKGATITAFGEDATNDGGNYTITISVFFYDSKNNTVGTPEIQNQYRKSLKLSKIVPPEATKGKIEVKYSGDNTIIVSAFFEVSKSGSQNKSTRKAPASQSYRGTMTRLGSKMEYSFSGGTVTSKKGVKYTGNDESDMSVYWAGEVAPGSTVAATCKKLAGRKNYKDIKVEIYATTNDGKKIDIQEKKGADLATASGKVPSNAKKVTMKMNYIGRLGRLYCFVNWDVLKEAYDTSSKSFKWDDVGFDDRCPKCNGQFSNYYVNNFVGDAYIICNGAPNEFKRKLENNHGKLVPMYYNDYIYTGSEDWVLLDYGDEEGAMKILGNSKILLMNKLSNGNPHWVISKGTIVGKNTNRATEPEFKMSQCTAKPTGTTYVLVDDGKTSRVMLLKGSMEVTSNKGSKKQALKPGQAATVSSNGKMQVDKFDVSATAKKYGISGVSSSTTANTNNQNNHNSSNTSKTLTAKTEKCSAKGVPFTMVRVDGGTFTMGATKEQGSNNSNQQPTHRVALSTYYIGQTEVTQELWQAVMGSNPSKFKGSNLPVENVNWNECQQFISKLNKITGKKFRLPTEAEWEFAARGGNLSRGYKFAGSNNPDAVAWHEGNSGKKTHYVGTKAANELGIYDMSGNVWEWCQDWFGNYSSRAQTNPKGASSGTDHLNRGGGWCHDSNLAAVFFRGTAGKPDRKVDNLGLRLVLEP